MYKGAKLSCNRYLGCKWDKNIINKRVRNLHKEAKPSCVIAQVIIGSLFNKLQKLYN
jgi:hypothetical protein